MHKDCRGVPYPVFAQGEVINCKAVKGAVPENSVFELNVSIKNAEKPVPGQFYMLHAVRSDVLLGRPISVFHATENTVTFLILVKGKGTQDEAGTPGWAVPCSRHCSFGTDGYGCGLAETVFPKCGSHAICFSFSHGRGMVYLCLG